MVERKKAEALVTKVQNDYVIKMLLLRSGEKQT